MRCEPAQENEEDHYLSYILPLKSKTKPEAKYKSKTTTTTKTNQPNKPNKPKNLLKKNKLWVATNTHYHNLSYSGPRSSMICCDLYSCQWYCPYSLQSLLLPGWALFVGILSPSRVCIIEVLADLEKCLLSTVCFYQLNTIGYCASDFELQAKCSQLKFWLKCMVPWCCRCCSSMEIMVTMTPQCYCRQELSWSLPRGSVHHCLEETSPEA